MTREDREDTSRQEAAVNQARETLALALDHLGLMASSTAKRAFRAAWRQKGGPLDLPSVYTAARAVERAEEALDLALLDLHTAQGGDA